MTLENGPSLAIALIGILGAIVAAWFGAERAGRYSLQVARENRQADLQRETLRDIQDQLPAYMDIIDKVRFHAWAVAASDDSNTYPPPPPTKPLSPGEPESLDEYRLRLLHEDMAQERRFAANLDRLNSRVTDTAIKAAVKDLLAINWYRVGRTTPDHGSSCQDNRRKALNDMIGPKLSEY